MIPAQEPIPAESNALRRARRSEINSSGKVRKCVFLPSKSGKDRDGLSVSIERTTLRELHRQKYEGDGAHCACYLRVASVQELQPLNIIPMGNEDDPAHALIIGIPDLTLGNDELARANYFAGELAKLAKRYVFPAPK